MSCALNTHPSWLECFDRDGVAIVEGLLTPDQVAEWIDLTRTCSSGMSEGTLERGGEVYGVARPALADPRDSPAGGIARATRAC